MKYLPLHEIENVNNALNFKTSDCDVVGGCDIYITKANRSDKKLTKDIEDNLESQHESLVQLANSLSPPNAERLLASSLFRTSPFGPLSKVSSRRTFAYLIATLNASHPDYDFSDILRPTDFRKESDWTNVMHTLDETLYNLRPKPVGSFLSVPRSGNLRGGHRSRQKKGGSRKKSDTKKTGKQGDVTDDAQLAAGSQTPGGSQAWSPQMWSVIDNAMTLKDCEIYTCLPGEDPFDAEESALWSFNYFFFNKRKKRVCYLFLRGYSILSHSPSRTPASSSQMKRTRPPSQTFSLSEIGAHKRARYWLGDRADAFEGLGWDDPGDDEVDVQDRLGRSDASSFDFSESEDDDEIERICRSKGAVRSLNDHIAESMDV